MNTVSDTEHVISWEEAIKIDTTVPLVDAGIGAEKLGYQYFIRSQDVYDVSRCARICQIDELRIYLEIKEDPQKPGIFWDEFTSMWYGSIRNSNLQDLCQFSCEIDRTLLSCPKEEQRYAIMRGATQSIDKQLFLPKWYWLSNRLIDVARRLCYWLPKEHAESVKFKNEKLAAEWISLNAGYTPVNAYLPLERAYLETLCEKEKMYICEADVTYFRWKHWDNY